MLYEQTFLYFRSKNPRKRVSSSAKRPKLGNVDQVADSGLILAAAPPNAAAGAAGGRRGRGGDGVVPTIQGRRMNQLVYYLTFFYNFYVFISLMIRCFDI